MPVTVPDSASSAPSSSAGVAAGVSIVVVFLILAVMFILYRKRLWPKLASAIWLNPSKFEGSGGGRNIRCSDDSSVGDLDGQFRSSLYVDSRTATNAEIKGVPFPILPTSTRISVVTNSNNQHGRGVRPSISYQDADEAIAHDIEARGESKEGGGFQISDPSTHIRQDTKWPLPSELASSISYSESVASHGRESEFSVSTRLSKTGRESFHGVSRSSSSRPPKSPGPLIPGRKPRHSLVWNRPSLTGYEESQNSDPFAAFFNPLGASRRTSLNSGMSSNRNTILLNDLEAHMAAANDAIMSDTTLGQRTGGGALSPHTGNNTYYRDRNISDTASNRDSMWDDRLSLASNVEIDFPVAFKGDPLLQVSIQIGWNCWHDGKGQLSVEISEDMSNISTFIMEGYQLKSHAITCDQIDSNFFHYATSGFIREAIWGSLPIAASASLGRYEDQALVRVTEVRSTPQTTAGGVTCQPKYIATMMSDSDVIYAGTSCLIMLCDKRLSVSMTSGRIDKALLEEAATRRDMHEYLARQQQEQQQQQQDN